ncbi:MAG: hypothetical protein Fur0022_40940 [Anaerolineales bacterium]
MNIREQLIRELDEAREKMRAVAQLADENAEIYASWKIKEVLAHITGWDDATIAALRAHTQGHLPATPAERGIDYYNAETVSTREALSYAHIVREWESTREQLRQVIYNLPDAKLDQPLIFPWGPTGMVPQIVRIMSHHESKHADEIKELLQKSA